MQTWPGLHPEAERQGSTKWAVLLCIGYLLSYVFELSMIRFTPGNDGRWVVTKADVTNPWIAIAALAFVLCSFLLTVFYAVSLFREWVKPRPFYEREVAGSDVLHTIALLYGFQTALTLLYGFFLPSPLFEPGSIGGLLENSSLHLFILLLALVRFHGKWGQLGFRKPRKALWMWIALFVLFFLVAVALDRLVTNPISDLLQLSTQSDREQEIAEEIVQAKTTNWINSLLSFLVIGGIVPLAEEILYRGVIQTYLTRRWGAWLGILLTSFWFALSHLDIALFAPLFVIGLAIGFMRHAFQSLWGAILLHSANNLASVWVHFL